MGVNANVLGDVHTKVEGFKKFATELAEMIALSKGRENYPPATEDGKYDPEVHIAEFLVSLQGRILYGGLKYGPGSWKHVDLLRELHQELYDVAGYAFLEILKKPDMNDLHREWLMSMAMQAFTLWREVKEVLVDG